MEFFVRGLKIHLFRLIHLRGLAQVVSKAVRKSFLDRPGNICYIKGF